MSDQIKILAFAGSLRKDSYNKKLVKIAVKGAQEAGAFVTYIDLEDYPLPLYNQELEEAKGLPTSAKQLKELFLAHEGFLIASPEYNSSISGALKNVIDWVSRPSTKEEKSLICFRDKVVTLMSASPSDLGGLRGLVHTRSIFSNLFSLVLPKQKCIPQADKAFDAAGNLHNLEQQKGVLSLGKELALFLQRLHP